MAASTDTRDPEPLFQRLARIARGAVAPLADASRPPAGAVGLSTVLAFTRGIAFWASICLPAVHVPLLLLEGLNSATTPALVALWTCHAVVLVVGARHNPGDADAHEADDTATPRPAGDD